MEKVIKIVLAILFFLCLFDMPYSYFQLVRFGALIGFGILAFKANENNNQTEMVIYVALAILFQPIFKIAIGRDLWNVIDVIVGVGLLITIFKDKLNSTD